MTIGQLSNEIFIRNYRESRNHRRIHPKESRIRDSQHSELNALSWVDCVTCPIGDCP